MPHRRIPAMRLRRVAVSCVKTCARRSEVVLEPGITAVAGPNGGGKSNLVDAIRWALGETNARELRGARMDEVIYAGGQGRAPMGMAEVVLTLDNEEGRLPIDEPEEAIHRRVTRNGDIEYRLNSGRGTAPAPRLPPRATRPTPVAHVRASPDDIP